MKLLTEITGVVDYIELDILKGHDPSRLLAFACGTEHFTGNNVSSYDPVAGRINFAAPINDKVRLFICD